ncbi:MAG TPA: SUMF1/EgtB/PvdO family nonheme iron enzyme [Terracidiphilus sp.]|nr:SUMF1/EgtB/PvdO family nonheme iron enzyme [Terracidiphilus sp.]
MRKYRSSILLLFAFVMGTSLFAQDTKYSPQGEQIPGPANSTATNDHCCAAGGEMPIPEPARKAWLEDVLHWRQEHLVRIGYSNSQYDRPEFQWTQSAFIQPQMMAHDRYFYDPATRKYTVDRYLADLEKRYGGIDAVLIWPTYPNIGIDNRNQFDLIRDMPGGIDGLRAMVQDFHKHGVHVLFPYNPWDQGTRPEGIPDWDTIAKLMADIGADGINGDTMDAVPLAFRTASDKSAHPIVFEPEGGDTGDTDPAIAWNNLGWGYWRYSFEPMISKNKWLEPRYMVNVCDRWNRSKTDNLQYAFFNGVGYESWENIWGIWNQIDDRDAEALRRISTIERAFWRLLQSPAWEPFAPTLHYGAYASKWPADTETLWTIVNRNEFELSGPQIEVPWKSGLHYYDLWHGVALQPEIHGSTAVLSFPIGAHAYGAILATDQLPADQQQTLNTLHKLAQKPLSSFSDEWRFLPQHIVPIAPTPAATNAPPGMVYIPGAEFDFRVSGVMIKGGNDIGVDVQYPWENSPRRQHNHEMQIKPFYIDKFPVTNAEFKKFLDATRYQPEDSHNFLRDWKNGTYPPGWGDKPVTWVSLDDARAYAKWAGKRLPHEWEWQYAAQGADGRLYPWGNQWNAASVPVPDKERTLRGPDDVNAHPAGASPFGVVDLVGNVWQWTGEFIDEHTRSAILRGGSYYQPQGSRWYFPAAYRLDEHGKYLLMAPSIDRAATIGFRCVKDAR